VPWLFFTKHRDWAEEEEVQIVGSEFPPTRLNDVLEFAKKLGCGVSQVLWRNGFPVRTPVST